MRKLVKADVRRILRKIVIYVFALLMYLILFIMRNNEDPSDQMDMFRSMVEFLGNFLVLVPVYLTVYGDEMKAGTMQCLIGRGMARIKVAIGKLIDCAILSGLMLLGLVLVFYLKNYIGDVILTPKQNQIAFIYAAMVWIKLVGYYAIAGIMLFATWSSSLGLITTILLLFVRVGLKTLQENTHLGVYDKSFSGLLEDGYNDILIGNFPWQIIVAVVVYIGGALLITYKLFDRKELDL